MIIGRGGMPIQTKAVDTGIISPSELIRLSQVFHATVVDGETDRQQREARASRIIGYCAAGVTDEVELCTLAMQPLSC